MTATATATMGYGRPESLVNGRQVSATLLFLFLLGWATEDFSLIDFGRYSVPLLYLAALPFCALISPRSVLVVVLPAVSTLLAVVAGLMTGLDPTHIASQTVLQVLAILFAAGASAIDWRAQAGKLAKALVIAGVPVVVYGGYQMVARTAHLPLAFLRVTNNQEYASGGLQRGWEKAEFTRASSVFVEPAAFGYFCLWLIVFGLSLAKGRMRNTALALGLCGILFSQSLSAALGAAILYAVYVLTHPINMRLVQQFAIFTVVIGLGLALIPSLVPGALERFSERIGQAVSLNEDADSGRVDHLPACWELYRDAPVWGHGISSLSAAGADGSDVTTVSYALLLMERGAVGTILFLAPWVVIAIAACGLRRADPYRTLAILLSVLNLYAFATSSVAYFLPFWLSLGITASLVMYRRGPGQRQAVADTPTWAGLA